MPCLLNNHRVEALGFFGFIFEKFARVGDGAFHLLVGSPFAQVPAPTRRPGNPVQAPRIGAPVELKEFQL